MNSQHDNGNGLLDEDPALDYILQQEVEQEKVAKGKIGYLGILLIVLLPVGYGVLHFTLICPLTAFF